MRMKCFTADSMPDAIRMVRAELGDGAVIIASQKSENGRSIRVTAAVEGNGPDDDPLPAVDEPLDAIEAIADALDRHGTPAPLAERLLHAAAPLAERLARAAQALAVDAPIMTLAAALDTLYTFRPLPERQIDKPVTLVGPPGSGKTVTTAKLAARAVLSNQRVSVITTDTMRAGGIDQLQAFTRVLDIDLQTALDADSLVDALSAAQVAQPDALTFIDTAGTNPFDAGEMRDLANLLDPLDTIVTLVLPAGYDCEEAAEIARAFKSVGAQRLLITRLDAARRLGSILVAADIAKLQFCDLSVTPHVAEGLSPINPVSLARLLLPEIPPATSVIAQFEASKL